MTAVLLSLGVAYLKRHYKHTLEQKYVLSLVQLLIVIFLAIELIHVFDPKMDLSSLLLKSSALVVAVLGFAAQPVIMNIICGLLISFQKPFEIGDRIVVEGHEAGIVEDITLRHTVLRIYDGLRIIIPNGELNSKTVTNLSYHMKDRRGIHMRFSVGYDTDLEKAMEVIRDCVAESPYTLGVETDGLMEDSGPVHFLDMEDSALVLRTTIWVSRDTNTQKAATDVNLRVIKAFRKYGIEIPYPYLNVVQFEGSQENEGEAPAIHSAHSGARLRRSETVRMPPGENRVSEAVETARRFAERQKLPPNAGIQMELLTEEAVDLLQRLLENARREFWVEGTAKIYRIHIRAAIHLSSVEEYKKMVALSSAGRNEAVTSINRRILEAMVLGRQRLMDKKKSGKETFEWKLSDSEVTEEEIGKSILTKFANDVRISVTDSWVEMIVMKAIQ